MHNEQESAYLLWGHFETNASNFIMLPHNVRDEH